MIFRGLRDAPGCVSGCVASAACETCSRGSLPHFRVQRSTSVFFSPPSTVLDRLDGHNENDLVESRTHSLRFVIQ